MFDRFKGDLRVVTWPEHKLYYVRVPKSGNTSISKAISGGEKSRVRSAGLERRRPDWTVFSFVRNPWSRLVSTYCQKVDLDMANQKKMVDGVFQGFKKLGIPVHPGMPFEEFIELICDLPDENTDKHLRSQCSFLVRDGRVVPSFVGRVESMAEDWNGLMARLGLDFPMLHLNRTQHDEAGRYFKDVRLRNLVGDRYRDDVERFGYEAPE